MIRLLFLVVFAISCDMCLTQRLCGIPRPIPGPPAIKYTITPAKPAIAVGRPIIETYDILQMPRATIQLQDPVMDDCGCFSSEIISKLIDALVVSTTMRNNGRNEGNLLNVALGDTDLLGVSI